MDKVIARLDALEAQQFNSAASGPYPAGVGSTPPRAGGDSTFATDPEKAKTPEQQETERRRQLQQLESEFAHDAADPARGTQMQGTLDRVITSPTMISTGTKPDNSRIDCRAHLCRIDANFAKAGDAQDWATFYLTAAGEKKLSQSRVIFLPQPGGGSQVRIFGKRNDP